MKHKYIYDGPVMEFDKTIAWNWKGVTKAPSEKKARCNLTYQFKQENCKNDWIKITLPGEITRID